MMPGGLPDADGARRSINHEQLGIVSGQPVKKFYTYELIIACLASQRATSPLRYSDLVRVSQNPIQLNLSVLWKLNCVICAGHRPSWCNGPRPAPLASAIRHPDVETERSILSRRGTDLLSA